MIRFGPAGIPLSCKGRTLKDGIEDVHNLGLTAMEVQMVRVNIVERYADDEEIGLSPLELEDDLVMQVIRESGGDEVAITDPTDTIEEDDVLLTLTSGIAKNYGDLERLGEMSRQLDVRMSMHTPYYMDLSSNNDLTLRCIDNIRWAGRMTHQMGGTMVVTHMGLYGPGDRDVAKEHILDNIFDVMGWWEDNDISPRLGLETSGRHEVFGSIEEIIDICDKMGGIGPVPVINFAHMHARENGIFREPEDFGEAFDRIEELVGGEYYVHFAGVEHYEGDERRITPIKKGDLRFEPLAEYLVQEAPDVTIVSSSPLLEHDAMYMKVIYERSLTKKVMKDIKRKRKEDDVKDRSPSEEEDD